MKDLKNLTNEQLIQYYTLFKKNNIDNKRFDGVKNIGFDSKYSYHLIRLLDECQQILTEGDLTLGRNAEYYKNIRLGLVPLAEVEKKFYQLQENLEKLYIESKLRERPDEEQIKNILLKCLEHHYGSLDKCINEVGKESVVLRQIKQLVKDY